jgi:hypothetical protein
MSISRRTLILGAGATGLVLAGGVWRVTRLPEAAIKPWMTDGPPPADMRLAAFRHAILAPNPHNRQPWMIRLVGPDEAEISCDLAKRLPETDPFDRQITIGFGTFLETARIAAAERGVRMEMMPLPLGEPQPRLDVRPVARVRFIKDASTARDPLFAAIGQRHTNRLVYDPTRPVAEADLARLVTTPDGFTATEARIAPLRKIAVDSIRIEQETHRTHMESVNLMRIGHAEIDATPDGLALSGPMMESLTLIGQLDRAQLADPSSTAYKTGLTMQAETYGSTPALFWIITPGNTRADQLEAGRRYVRAQLQASLLGLAVHPMSQALQEYPEVAAQYAEIHRQLGAKAGERIQMFARVGYADPVRPAARWPLEKHIIA